MINKSKETVYHGGQDDVQSVHSMYEVTERDRKLKPGWKVLVGGLCTLAMLLVCTNVVLSSRRENKDHPIDYEMRVPRVLPVRNDTLCERGGHQFKLGQSNKRLTVCTYERRVLIDVREFIGYRLTIKGIQLTTTENFTLKVLMPRVSDELMRQMKLLRE